MQQTASNPGARRGPLGRLVAGARAHPAVSVAAVACLAGAVMVAWSAFHESDRDRIGTVLGTITEGIVKGDEGKVMAHVSPFFSEEGIYREQLREGLTRILRHRPLSRISPLVRQLNVEHGTATAIVYVESRQGDAFRGTFARTEWLITLEELGGRWLVRHATPLRLDGRRVAGLRAIMALGY